MAFITGATVTFTDYSAPGTPRILNVPDAWGDVLVQDIWDTLSEIAGQAGNFMYAPLIKRPLGGGKSVLSATKSTGITCVGNNVQLKFEDLGGPGYTIKRVTDGNWIAIDHNGDPMESMANSTFVNWKNEADVSAAIVDLAAVSSDLATVLANLTALQSDLTIAKLDSERVRKAILNRSELVAPDYQKERVYDDDNATPYVEWTYTDKTGAAVTVPAGVQAKRGPPDYSP